MPHHASSRPRRLNQRPRRIVLKALSANLESVNRTMDGPEVEPFSWSFDLPATLAELDFLAPNRYVPTFARFGLDEKTLDLFWYAVMEALTNAVQHGAPSAERTVRVWLWKRPYWWRCTVEVCNGLRPNQRVVITDDDPHPSKIRKRGNSWLTKFSDQVVITTVNGQYYRVAMTKFFPRPIAP